MNCQHTPIGCDTKNHDFQVRYSTSPITTANFSSATIAGTFNYLESTWNQVAVLFNITNTDDSGATHYYFAVDDMDDGTSYVSKIDYMFGSSSNLTPISRSNGQPTGTLSSGTTQTNISLTTNVNATCRYSNVSGTNYTDMESNFTSTNSINHSTEISGLENGKTYTYYIRCNSSCGYVNDDDFNISFSVDGHKADLNDDGVVDMKELMAYIARWKTGDGVSRVEVEEARVIWFAGGVY
ncbi:MAG: hypothetical protein U9M95_04070 [Candidatus Altiarchaeota archaeon]|nr:hypothetical protein [Candidatus Altiarchaeota archaeon]